MICISKVIGFYHTYKYKKRRTKFAFFYKIIYFLVHTQFKNSVKFDNLFRQEN